MSHDKTEKLIARAKRDHDWSVQPLFTPAHQPAREP
jgi:hypothetical protein